jgi:hypothetical protein
VIADEHSVTLTVWSSSLTAADLAARIGVEPDERWDRGDTLRSGRTRQRSAVRYTSGFPRRVDASEQVSALLSRLATSAPHIRELSEMPGADVTLSVGYFVNEPQWQEGEDGLLVRGLGVALDTREIDLLHAMGASFDVDFYVPTDERE